MRFTAAVTHEGSWQVARCLEVEVASQGGTVEEALANLREALELYFEDEMLPDSIEPPIIATIELSAGARRFRSSPVPKSSPRSRRAASSRRVSGEAT